MADVGIAELLGAVKAGDARRVRMILGARPELVHTDTSGGDERRALHYAVMRRDLPMVTLLLQAGADARKGVFPHRDATSAYALARDREFVEIVTAIEEEERLRREELSCPNATITDIQERVNAAIADSDTAAAKRLLEEDLSLIQACDREGATPLHHAAEEGNAELVEWLLERRAPVRKEDLRGFMALDRAALEPTGFPAVADVLLRFGAPLTIRGAIGLANEERVRELIGQDAALLRKTDRNGGLLTCGVRHGHVKIARLLLDLGADVDERVVLEELEKPTVSWGMPLWQAALAGNLAITQLLLDRGADPNANVYASGWPLRNAWDHEDESVKRLLLERGAKRHPYMVAETHDVAEAERILREDPAEDVVHELLWSAADSGCAAIVKLALKRLSWPWDDPRWHWVMIQPMRGAGSEAVKNQGHFEALRLLLEHGVDASVSRFGQTILHFAAAYRGPIGEADRARFAALALDYGAKLDRRDEMLRSTPLGWACRWGRVELTKLLLRRGARVEEEDAEPWATPREWARKMGRGEIATLLDGR